MFRVLVRSKIQRLTVTDKNLMYEGSLELDSGLLAAADLLPGELVNVVNTNNGARFETYVIAAPAGTGRCVLNGGAARLGEVGDELIVWSIVLLEEADARAHRLKCVNVDKDNSLVVDCDRSRSR
uniref:Aspartate 1-decarboxylase n=1 Tax=candidate division WOR-3 bacterium TaxID=2052148 RepID=A0A7C4CC41_UNCW3